MENESKEENKSKTHKLIAPAPDWLDLPNPIATNIILEHLEIVDYIRFSGVCKTWQLIQKEHRNQYSPYEHPWLTWLKYNGDTFIHFYLPNKQKTYKLSHLKTAEPVYTTDCKHGWLLLVSNVDVCNQWLCIFNPITGDKIQLPPFLQPTQNFWEEFCAAISSPPTDSNCTIMMMFRGGKIYLCRLNDNGGWKPIKYSKKAVFKTVFFNNKIYSMTRSCERIYMVDALLPEPVEQMIEMDPSEICTKTLYLNMFDLAGFLGELVMIISEYNYSCSAGDGSNTLKEFHFYRADFSTNKWVRMKTFGDHALFISWFTTFSLPAADVGCEKNTVYSTKCLNSRRIAWRAFNLSTKDWTDGPPMSVSLPGYRYNSNGEECSWFFPTLDYYDGAKMIGAAS